MVIDDSEGDLIIVDDSDGPQEGRAEVVPYPDVLHSSSPSRVYARVLLLVLRL